MTPPDHARHPGKSPSGPSARRTSLRRRVAALGLAAGVATAGTVLLTQAQAAAVQGSLPAGTQFYKDPNSQVVKWAAANPGDSRQPVISAKIASQPQAVWFSVYSPSTVTADVSKVTSAAAAAGQVPVLVAYTIPNRDCGGASAGGAPDLASYDSWARGFAAGLGSGPSVVILEPDSIALTTCLNSQQLSDRYASLSRAGAAIHAAAPQAKVYMDGGHSTWNSASEQANRLRGAGVLTNADGFYTNVSNFNTTSGEVSYDKAILSALGNPSHLHAVVDTSRNGNGPAGGGAWCDPSGRSLGNYPTVNTGDAAIDAFLWVKPPGEADGCAGKAGTFLPDIAYALAVNAPNPPTSPPPTTPPPSSPPPTNPPSAGACAVSYRISSSWAGGFNADVTVKNSGGAAINGWTLKWTFPNDQKVVSAWNATATQSGNAVTVTNLSYNGSLPAGGSTSFGFQGSSGSANSAPTGFTLNGTACTAS
ncbi:glycoside hydrolase family 6 protein [Streptomyces sp. NPDC088337]|uniref:glycoside hydrolase family 6 protein n=1 Tax=unclassified Streptomyces TaxID=2593676 RepID=UPI002DD8F894|nr:glycoside hydrolase family 6 protein [Streptomyces sp. NBC_01788]WSB30737.1 glycoside hydrolase family 6 protein [Streptomyces sp. NBC_01788]